MENRKFVGLLLFLFVFTVSKSFAYEVETHAFLTKAVVDFYNKNFDKKISDELKEYIIDGARLEDNAPRFLNHFYDPMNDRGLADLHFEGAKSKEWAQNKNLQTGRLYKIFSPSEASILSATQIDKIKPVFKQHDFTWQKAVELYAEGETEDALFVLGHIVHLIEDAAVPDHTRNDAHPPLDDGGSPYENWTGHFTLKTPDYGLDKRLIGKKPIVLNDLNQYFEAMAKYSNNNFYSRDSIKNYDLPKPDYFVKINGDRIGFKKDKEFGDYRLASYSGSFDWAKELPGDMDQAIVIREYWERLSTKAIQHGAGVIDLFFKEGEKAKAEYEPKKAQRPFLGTLIDGFKALFGGDGVEVKNEQGKELQGNLLAEISLGDSPEEIPPSLNDNDLGNELAIVKKEELKPNDNKELIPIEQFIQEKPKEIAEIPAAEKTTEKKEVAPEPQLCNFVTTAQPTHRGAILNEVSWMGSANSATDEWLELKNDTNGMLDISGWQVLERDGQIKIVIPAGTKLEAHGFYLLERTDDTTVPGIYADQIYTGALANVGEGLRLFDNNCGLIDEAWAAPDWPAGDNANKQTMERATDFSWRNYSGNGVNGISGTPKAQNSVGMINGSQNTGGAAPALVVPPANQTPAPPPSTPTLIVISEIRAGTDVGGAEDEFIELYNAGDSAVDLVGWSLKKKTSSGSESNLVSAGAFIGTIQPHKFFLIAHQNYQGGKVKDLEYSANSNNIAYTNNSAVLYDAGGGVVDEVSWAEIEKDKSFERKALSGGACASAQGGGELLGNGCDMNATSDFETRVTPNPQNTNDAAEPRAAPLSVGDFRVSYNSSAMALVFDWTAIASTTYRIFEMNGVTTTQIFDGVTSPLTKTINEVGREFQFGIVAIDDIGLQSATATASIIVPSFFSSVAFHEATTSQYRLDVDWATHPLIPIIPGQWPVSGAGKEWQVAILYYNVDAPAEGLIRWLAYRPEELPYADWGLHVPNGLIVQYLGSCSGGGLTSGSALILPDGPTRCNPMVGRQNGSAMQWSVIAGRPISLQITSGITPVAGQDFVTVAFYTYQHSNPLFNELARLVAIDKTRYYFSP